MNLIRDMVPFLCSTGAELYFQEKHVSAPAADRSLFVLVFDRLETIVFELKDVPDNPSVSSCRSRRWCPWGKGQQHWMRKLNQHL